MHMWEENSINHFNKSLLVSQLTSSGHRNTLNIFLKSFEKKEKAINFCIFIMT